VRRRALAVALLACAACGDARPGAGDDARATATLPAAEFLLVSDDSTVWVRTGASGARVQRSPLVLAALDGRLVELFAAEAVRDHEGASFTWGRLWVRDLVRNDSALVFEEPTVRDEAAAYARTHRGDPVLEEDEAEGAGTPPYAVNASVTLLDVAGPLAGIEVHVDRWRDDSLVAHDTRWLTVDLARRARVPLATLVGDAAAVRVRADARAALARAASDAARAPVATAADAAAVLRALAVDDEGWVLDVARAAPAVRFLAHASHDDDAHRFTLPALPIAAPAWWRDVRASLPLADADSVTTRVGVAPLVLEATTDTGDVATVRVAGTTLLRMAGPVRRMIPLGATLALPDLAWRPALQRAFVEAGYYSDEARAVRHAGPRPSGARLRPASATRRRPTRAATRLQ
jgi:hypothetical protein